MKRGLWLTFGFALMALALLWHFAASPSWRQRFHSGWELEFNFIGISTLPDPETGQFPLADSTAIHQRLFNVMEQDANTVTMQDHYLIHDPVTGEISYNYIFRAEVDAVTGAHLDPRYPGDYYLFPREVKKTTYRIRHSYLKGIPLAFQLEEKVEGLPAYLFSYQGPGEYTESYAAMQAALGRPIEAGQEIRCADDQFRINMWVEPVTGAILKIDESCYAGDYVYDIATGEALFPVLRWGAVTAGDEVQERSNLVSERRMRYLWATRYFPMLLIGMGLVCLLTAAYSPLAKRQSRHAQPA